MGNSLFLFIIAGNTSEHATDKCKPRCPLTQFRNISPVVTQHTLQGFFPHSYPGSLTMILPWEAKASLSLEKHFLGEWPLRFTEERKSKMKRTFCSRYLYKNVMCFLSKSHKEFNIIFGKFSLTNSGEGSTHQNPPEYRHCLSSLFMSETQRFLAAWRSTPVWAQLETPCL